MADERVCIDCTKEGVEKPQRVISPKGTRYPRCWTHQRNTSRQGSTARG